MIESATDVIVARSKRGEPLGRTIAGSVAGHALAAVLVLAAATLTDTAEPPRTIMTINLNTGSAGPKTDGTTQIGGRKVEQVAPPEPVKSVQPASEARPKMTVPEEKPRPRPATRKPAATEPAPPATGAQVIDGSTKVDTGTWGTGFGLSSTGGSGTASVQLDTTDFCCNEYLQAMIHAIERNWDRHQGARGVTVMKFTILRNGRLNAIEVERPSGMLILDRAAERALSITRLQPLPNRYTNSTLTVHISFYY